VTKDRYIVPAGDRKKRGRPPKTMEQRAANKLTRRQELFVKELVSKDGQVTMKEAAINAGYPEKSASSRAYELTNPKLSPHVCRAIQEYRRELDSKYGIDYQRHVRDLQRIRDMALSDKAYSAAVMAEYRRGQAQGDIYVSKSEVRHGTIESMSKEEVMKALKEIKEQYETSHLFRGRTVRRRRRKDSAEKNKRAHSGSPSGTKRRSTGRTGC
jgi:phage terminase small subunit